jgi:hypothetical protein
MALAAMVLTLFCAMVSTLLDVMVYEVQARRRRYCSNGVNTMTSNSSNDVFSPEPRTP